MSTAPAAQCARSMSLTGPALFTWIALRRVHAGRVARFEGHYYDFGLRVPSFLDFDPLISAGLLTFAEPAPEYPGLRRVTLTREGLTRFAVLNAQERNARSRGNAHRSAVNDCQ